MFMQESIHDYVLAQLKAMTGPHRWRSVADATGISIRTIEKIGYEKSKNPRIKTIGPLYRYFRDRPSA